MSDLVISDIGGISSPVASFATLAELANHTGGTVDATRGQHFLDLATAEIRRYIVDPETVTETVTLDGTGTDYLFLVPPVTALASITIEGTLVASTRYTWKTNGTVRGVDGYTFGTKPQSVVVSYTHGYASVPADIKLVCLNAAARALTDEGDSVLSGGIPEARGWGPEIRLRPEEFAILAGYEPVPTG